MMHRLVNIVSGRQVATRFHDKPRLLATAAGGRTEEEDEEEEGKKDRSEFSPVVFQKSRGRNWRLRIFRLEKSEPHANARGSLSIKLARNGFVPLAE